MSTSSARVELDAHGIFIQNMLDIVLAKKHDEISTCDAEIALRALVMSFAKAQRKGNTDAI